MKKLIINLILICLFIQSFSQENKQIKSFNITLIQGNFDKYGFSKEYHFANFSLVKDTFFIRYAKSGIDTSFKVSIQKKDSAIVFIQELLNYKNLNNYSDLSKPDSTINGNKLAIRINNKQQTYTFSTPINTNTELKSATDWLISYAANHCNKNSKTNIVEYLTSQADTSQSGILLPEIISRFSYPNQKKTIECLKKTNDWNIILGIYKAFCLNVTKQTKEAVGARFDTYINDTSKTEAYTDILICQNNDDYIKGLLIKATQSKNIRVKEKAALYLASQGVIEMRPLIIDYIKRTITDNDKKIRANSYFIVTSRIFDNQMLKDMIHIYQQQKSNHSIALKELMHAIECNIECYRNIHNEYTLPDFQFDFDTAMKRLDEKIAQFENK